MSNGVPSVPSVLATLMGVTWRRLARGRALWVCLLFATFPLMMAFAQRGGGDALDATAVVQLFVTVLLPPVFVASAIGEEIEDRTTTYLWSRPLPRWTVLVGKLLALAPVATLLVVAGWLVAVPVATGEAADARMTIGFAAGALAVSAMAAGIGTLVPRHGVALSIVYLVILDTAISAIPASIQSISITRQIRLLVGAEDGVAPSEAAITMALIAGVWLAIGFWRIRRLES